jgi:hypothetical protein
MARTESGSDLVDRLVSSYAVEADIYRSLLALTQEQGSLLENGEVDRCAQLFERKDDLLRSLARIEVELEPLKRRWQAEPIETVEKDRARMLRLADRYRAVGGPSIALVDAWRRLTAPRAPPRTLRLRSAGPASTPPGCYARPSRRS